MEQTLDTTLTVNGTIVTRRDYDVRIVARARAEVILKPRTSREE